MLLALILATALAPVLPVDQGPRAPGQLSTQGPGAIPSANTDDPRLCGSCHADIAAQWRTSAHAFASFNNPLYRVSIDAVRTARGAKASRMCASCHDLALLTTGAIDEEISADDPRAHAGISCTSCHSAVHASNDGNGSLVLRSDTALPSPPEDTSLEGHRKRVASTTLRTAELCGSCHRSFLDTATGNEAAFFGMDDYGTWLKSAWAQSTAERPDHVEARDCRGCHMPREKAVRGDVAAKNGTVPSHRFLGAHTLLAAMEHDDTQLAMQQEFLRNVATLDVAAARVNGSPWVMPADAATAKAGDRLDVDVVIFNELTGHRFPGGVLDNQGTRVFVELTTANGRVLATSSEHQVRAEVVNRDGKPVTGRETHEFVAAVWNHTVPPRDARVVRVHFEVPAGLSEAELPLEIGARLVHTSRLAALSEEACEDSKTPRGKAFSDASTRFTGATLDACVAQPETIVSSAKASLGGSRRPTTWLRAYRRGLGLSVALQEYLGDAQDALEAAQKLTPAGDRDAATRVTWALGNLAAHRGQLAEALEHVRRAESLGGATAATWRARGDAYAQVWQWPAAAKAYREAAKRAPNDLTAWAALAMAEASSAHDAAALEAAQRGLALHPRDGDCLRVQALMLEKLGAPAEVTSTALDSALHWRAPDNGPSAKAKCSKNVPGCAQRRNPVPFFEAIPVQAPSSAGGQP